MNVTIQTSVDANLKKNADRLFSEIGLDLESAIRLFLTQAVIQKKIPFESVAPENFSVDTTPETEDYSEVADMIESFR